MSIKDYRSVACPRCQTDTMHLLMRCLTCGHISQTGMEQLRVARSAIALRQNRNMGEVEARNYRSVMRGYDRWLKRESRIKDQSVIPIQMVKRPRSINSERRKVKPEDDK